MRRELGLAQTAFLQPRGDTDACEVCQKDGVKNNRCLLLSQAVANVSLTLDMAGVHVSGIRLIFLDVDGVLCCNKHGHLEADKLKRLAGIVQRTNSKVVLSTDWRRHPELKQRLMQVLATHDCQVIGATLKGPALEPVRPREITAWLDGYETERHLHASPAVSSWVAVDDRPLLREDGGEALTGHFVQTIFQFGLDDIAAERMTAILLEDEKSTAKNTPPSTLAACTNTNVTPMAALWLSGGAAAPAPSPHTPLGVQVQWIHVSPPAAHVTATGMNTVESALADEERRERIGRHLRTPTSPSKPVEPAQHVPPSPVSTVTPTLSCVSPSPYGPSPTATRSKPSSPPPPSFQGGRWVQGKSSTDYGSASGAAAPKSLTCNDIGQLSGYSPAPGSAAPSVTSPGCGQSCCHAAPMYQHVPPKQAERSRQTRGALSRSSPPSITALRQVATMQSTMPPFASMMQHGLAFSHQSSVIRASQPRSRRTRMAHPRCPRQRSRAHRRSCRRPHPMALNAALGRLISRCRSPSLCSRRTMSPVPARLVYRHGEQRRRPGRRP